MKAINIFLIIAIGYILYILISNISAPKPQMEEGFKVASNDSAVKNYNAKRNPNSVENVVDDVVSWGTSNSSLLLDTNSSQCGSGGVSNDGLPNCCATVDTHDDRTAEYIHRGRLNPNFINNQFNNDYRDVMTAVLNLIPDKKQLFNIANEPLDYSEPETGEVRNIVTDFISVLNENLVQQVPSNRNQNSGWDEAIPDPNIKSGWDKVQDSLGLTSSLYDKPKTSADYTSTKPVRLVNINKVQKYETDDEIKYDVELVIQKEGVSDQMILKASFVQDKRPLYDENNFFVTTNVDLKIVIEDIFTIGYLSKCGTDEKPSYEKDKERFYDYNQLEYNNMLDPKHVQRVLMEKYKIRSEEMQQRNAMLDEEGQIFHKQLPSIYDFSNVRGTQTIFDDMNAHRTFV